MSKKLTFKQSQFISKVFEGTSQTSAYRNAYNLKHVPENHLGGSLAAQEAPPRSLHGFWSWKRKKRLGGACRRSLERIEFSKN